MWLMMHMYHPICGWSDSITLNCIPILRRIIHEEQYKNSLSRVMSPFCLIFVVPEYTIFCPSFFRRENVLRSLKCISKVPEQHLFRRGFCRLMSSCFGSKRHHVVVYSNLSPISDGGCSFSLPRTITWTSHHSLMKHKDVAYHLSYNCATKHKVAYHVS